MPDLGTNIWATLDALREALVNKIDEKGLEQPCLVSVMPGQEVALDYCGQCDNGMAWVRLVSVARLEDLGTGSTQGACAAGFTAILEMGWMRGGPIIEVGDDGETISVPDAAQLGAATIHQMADMTVMMQAMCAAKIPTGWKVKADGYTPFGPQGGCYGGLWAISIPIE